MPSGMHSLAICAPGSFLPPDSASSSRLPQPRSYVLWTCGIVPRLRGWPPRARRTTVFARVARAVLLVAVGISAITHSEVFVSALAIVLGLLIAYLGVAELMRMTIAEGEGRGPQRTRPVLAAIVVSGAAPLRWLGCSPGPEASPREASGSRRSVVTAPSSCAIGRTTRSPRRQPTTPCRRRRTRAGTLPSRRRESRSSFAPGSGDFSSTPTQASRPREGRSRPISPTSPPGSARPSRMRWVSAHSTRPCASATES